MNYCGLGTVAKVKAFLDLLTRLRNQDFSIPLIIHTPFISAQHVADAELLKMRLQTSSAHLDSRSAPGILRVRSFTGILMI